MAPKKQAAKKVVKSSTKTAKAREITKSRMGREIGRSGVAEYRGYVAADYNQEFNGRAGVLLCDKMRKTDGTVAAVLRALAYPIMASDWTIDSADKNDDLANEQAEFVRSQIMDNKYGTFNFNQFIREACGHLAFGFWYFEKVYDIREGWITLSKLASRIPTAHERWEMQSAPTVDGITQTLPSRKPGDEGTNQPEIPMSKLVLFVNEQEGDNNAGTPILRGAYKHFFMKDQLYRIDAVKHERGAGLLKVRYPHDNDRDKAEEMGSNFNVNEQMFMALPGAVPGPGEAGWDVEMMTQGIAEQSSSLMDSVRHHDRMIVQSVLAQFLDLGAGKTGSFALGETQMGFFGYALKAVADYMASVIDTQLIRELVDMNWGPQEAYPKIGAPRIGKMDQKQTAEILAILDKQGLLSKDSELKAWVTTAFGLPERTAEEIEEQEEIDRQNAPDMTPKDDEEEDDPDDKKDPDKTNTDEENEEKEKKDLAMKLARRKLTECEGRVKFADAKKDIDAAEKKAQTTLDTADEKQKESLLDQSSKAIDSGDIGQAMEVTAKVDASAKSELTGQAKESLESGKVMAANELGVAAPVTASAAKKAVAARIALYMQERADRLTSAVRKRLLDIIDGDMGKAAGLFELETVIDAANARTNGTMVGQIVMQPINNGRWLTFEDASAQIHGMQRSEILDDRTCPLCVSMDGRVLRQSDPMTQLGEVHDFCRGMWVGILLTDADLPEAKPLPKSIQNRFELVGGVPTTNGFRQMPKAIIKKDSRAAIKVKDGDLKI